MTITKKLLVSSLGALLLTAPLYASLKIGAVRSNNYTFAAGTANLVPLDNGGTTQVTFTGGAAFIVTYSAECAVSAAAGNDSTWVDIDIELVPDITNPAVVQVLSPTSTTLDGFCSSNGTAGADGWRASSIKVATPLLPSKRPDGKTMKHGLQIRARIQNGVAGNSGWLGDTALLIGS